MCKKRIVLLIAALVAIFCGCALFGCAEKDSGELSGYTGTSYSVTFYYNYDGAPNDGVYRTETVENDESVAKPLDPTREGYDFAGWCLDATGAAAVDVTTVSVVADMSFYARWNAKSSPETPTVTLESITITSLPTKLTYVVGESFSADGMIVTATYSDASSSVLSSAQYTVTVVDMSTPGVKTVTVACGDKTKTFDITVTVLTKYTVSYNSNCGSYTANGMPASASVVAGDKLNAPIAPTLKGFTFAAWFESADCAPGDAWDFSVNTVTGATTLYAKWLPKAYNVSYMLDGGANGNNRTTYTAENGVFENVDLADASKDHFDFDGWFTTPTFAANSKVTALSYSLLPDANNTITLYAKFTPKTYTISYEFDGSNATYAAAFKQTAVVPQSYVFGNSVVLPDASAIAIENKSDDEYNFLGWCAQPLDGDDPQDDDPQYVTTLPATAYGNKVFYAHIAAVPVYTVTFDKNYTGSTPVIVNVIQGATVNAIDTPSRVGYEFIGWYNNGSEWSFATAIDDDTVLTASWNRITYNIQYKWGSSDVAVDNAYKTYNVDAADITLPEPAKTHYTFDGWFTSSNLTGNAVTVIGKSFIQGLTSAPLSGVVNVTLYAKYTPDNYSVTFNANKPTTSGAVTGMPTASSIAYGELIVEPNAPRLNGYTFGGWYTTSACREADAWDFDNDTVGGVTELYAKWDIITRNVTYVLDNGTNAQGNPTAVDVNSGTATLGNALKDYYTFGGWYSNSSFAESSKVTTLSFATLDGDITLYAKFTAIQYTVAYSMDGGSNPTSNPTAYVVTDGEVTLADATKDYYTFDGWYTDSAMSQNKKITKVTSAYFNTSSASTLTLYAKFVKIEYTVNYILPAVPSDAVNTQNNVSHSIYKLGDADYTLENAITATVGYRFVEWRNSDGERVTKIERAVFDPTGDVTSVSLTAVFSNMYKIRFDATDGSFAAGAETEVSLAYGSSVTAPTTAPTLDGHTLVGWYKDSTYANIWNFDEDTVSADITLYAKWMENPENGTYLVGSFNGWSMFDEHISDYRFTENSGANPEYTLNGVTLAADNEFKIVTYTDGKSVWAKPLRPTATSSVYVTPNGLITVGYSSADADSNYKITAYGAGEHETWTINLGTDTKGKYISFILDARDPSYGGASVVAKAEPTADVYLRGWFSSNFAVCDAWSSDSQIIDVRVVGDTYYFQNVYLTSYDEFKVYSTADDAWYGGAFASIGTSIALSSNNAPNIDLGALESGYYNIVFDNGTTKTVTIYENEGFTATLDPTKPIYEGHEPTVGNLAYDSAFTLTQSNIVADTSADDAFYVIYNGHVVRLVYQAMPVVLESITVKSEPTKTVFVKETQEFDDDGLVITARYTDGTEVDKTSGWTITLPTWEVGNGKTVTVKFKDGSVTKTATFTIDIIAKAITSVEWSGTLSKTYAEDDTFDAAGLAFTVTYNDGQVLNPTAAQMTFTSSALNASRVFTSSGNATITVSYGGTAAASAITLIVNVRPSDQTITVTYHYNHSPSDTSVTTGTYNKTTTVNTISPTRAGYTFDGWYKEQSCDTPFDDATWSEDIDLYAKWSLISYTVTYSMNGGTNAEGNPATYNITQGDVTLADPTAPTGKRFVGWYTAGEGGDRVYVINLDLFVGGATTKQLFAKYETMTYAVTFDLNGATGSIESQTIAHGAKAAEPSEPTRSGYEFGGWYTTAACADADAWDFESDTITSITTLYAKWTAIVREDGIYADGVFVKAFSDNASTDTVTKLKVENVDLAKNAVITFVYNHEDLDANLRTGTGMSARISKVDGNITVSGLAADKTHGTFSFYYASSGNEKGIWIKDEEDYVAPTLQDGDGLYNGSTPVKAFVLNDDAVNEVKAEDFKLTAETTLTVKYGGENKSVTIKNGCTLGAVSGGKIVLQAGTYSVYYSYSQNAVWINGTPDAPAKPSIAGYSYETVTTSNAYLVGKFDGLASFVSDEGFKMISNGGTEVKVEGFKVAANAGIKIRYSNGWYGYDNVHSQYGNKDLVTRDSDGNMVFKVAGTYKIYFNTSTKDIYLAKAS